MGQWWSFSDGELCNQAKLSTESLPIPKEVFALDGSLSA